VRHETNKVWGEEIRAPMQDKSSYDLLARTILSTQAPLVCIYISTCVSRCVCVYLCVCVYVYSMYM
jgi:hypothetical protein